MSRYSSHKSSFTHPNKKGETKLSAHIWELHLRHLLEIDRQGGALHPITGRCNLCTEDKFYILRKPEMASLNSRQEVGNHCRLIAMSLLSNVEKVKVPGIFDFAILYSFAFCLLMIEVVLMKL